MSIEIRNNRTFLSYVLAAAVLELFPGTQLGKSHIDDISFGYDFYFLPHIANNFSNELLMRIEDQMRMVVTRGTNWKILDMMRENARDFFMSKKQSYKAEEVEEYNYNVIQILQYGQFFDIAYNNLEAETQKSFFRLLSYTVNDNKIIINGSSFFEKKELKDFVKVYQDAQKFSYIPAAEKLNLFIIEENQWILLPKGRRFFEKLADLCLKAYEKQGFNICETIYPDHEYLFERWQASKAPFKIGSLHFFEFEEVDQLNLQFYHKDKATIFCQSKVVNQDVISSLQFIEKTIKIFGFEYRLHETRTTRGSKQVTTAYANELPSSINDSEVHYQFYLIDRLGKGWKSAEVKVMLVPQPCIGLTIFHSFESFMALMIERERENFSSWLEVFLNDSENKEFEF